MNNFNERFVVRKVMREYNKINKLVEREFVSYGLRNELTGKKSVLVVVLSKGTTAEIIGHGIYYASKNKLMIYDFNGDIISIHEDMIFKSIKKGKPRKLK